MFAISIIIAVATAVLSILFGLLLLRNIRKQPEGNKKIIDNVKLASKEVRITLGNHNSALAAISVPAFVLILYLINWETALGFLVGALVTIFINFILANMIVRNSGRVIEASRKGLPTAANIAFKSGTAITLIICGLAILVTAGFYAVFKNTESLIGLGAGVSLVALFLQFSKRISKTPEININPSIGFVELIILSMIATIFLGQTMFKNSDNPTLFPIVLASASTIVFALTSIFIRFFKNTRNIAIIFYRSIAIEIVLFAIATFFIFIWMMKGVGIGSMINFYGLAIISEIILFLIEYAILINIYNQVTKTAVFIAEKSEIPTDVKNHLAKTGLYERISSRISKLYSIKGTAFVSIVIFAGYYGAILNTGKSISFDLGNYLVLIGLLIGAIAVSLCQLADYFQKIKYSTESINKNILLSVIVLLVPVIIGLTLGPVALGGFVIGVLLTGLFASLFCSSLFTNLIKVSAVIALLIAAYIV